MADGATATYVIDKSYSSSFSSDGVFTNGTTTTNSNGGNSTDVIKVTVTAEDGTTTKDYYTAITVTG